MSADLIRLRAHELLATLVGFDTVSKHSNLALIEFVESYLSRHGITSERVNVSPTKSSLSACIGPRVAGGFVLSGHSDVVPVEGQEWHSEPFALTEKDGKFYGRGTSDMKSFLAVALAMVPEWTKQKLKKPAWLAISHDEEIGCLGAAPMAQHIAGAQWNPSLVVIGEPTNMKPVGAHKGILSFETIVRGKEAHSSNTHRGVNAVMVLAELIHCLNEIAEGCKRRADAASPFDPPYTTVHVGVAEGGVARNIIPAHARMAWEIRPVPGEDTDKLLDIFYARCGEMERAIKRVHPESSIRTQVMTNVRGLAPADAATQSLAMRLAETNTMGAVSFGTEAGVFQGYGLPVVVCGPGDIAQAHQPDEYIEMEQIDACIAFMHRLSTLLLDA